MVLRRIPLLERETARDLLKIYIMNYFRYFFSDTDQKVYPSI